MNCDIFTARLDALLAGDLDTGTQAVFAAHAARCARCGALLAALGSDTAGAVLDTATAAAADAFVASLLQRTSGSPCARALAELPDWVDGSLAADEAGLVAMHLHHCRGCAALAAVLRSLRQELPALAQLEPGTAFTATVVAATRSLRPRRVAPWLAVWQQLVGRPRLAWEFATAACFVLMLLCTLPFSPLRPLPQQALAMIRIDAVTVLQAAATQYGPAVQASAARAWAGSAGRVGNAIEMRWQAFGRRHADTAAAWSAVHADLGEVGDGIRSRNFAQVSHALQALGSDLRRVFGAVPAAAPTPGESP